MLYFFNSLLQSKRSLYSPVVYILLFFFSTTFGFIEAVQAQDGNSSAQNDTIKDAKEHNTGEEVEEPILCKVGIYIKTIRLIESEELFEVMFYYWLRVDSVDYNKDYSEISNIEFINTDVETTHDMDELDSVQNIYYVVGKCKAEIPYKSDYSRFPFDVQSLEISIENNMLNTQSLIFVPDNLTPPVNVFENCNIDILNGDQLSVSGLTAKQYTYAYETNFGDPSVVGHDKYSRMEFVINIERDPIGMIQKIVLPLLVVLILAYLVFFIPDYEIGTASALTVTALLAAIAFQWTLNDSLPNVSYPTLIDKIFYLVYFYIFYAMTQTVYTFNLSKRGESLAESDPLKSKKLIDLSERVEWHSRYLFPLTFFIIVFWLIYG
jgi:hypothetical protein